MLSFIKQYGKTVLFAIAGVAVLGIAFGIRVNGHTGFIQAAYGRAMEGMDMPDVRGLGDTDAVKAAAARVRPQIVFRCGKILPQVPVDLKAMLTARDADGNQVDVIITDIITKGGGSVFVGAACTPEAFVFPYAGIYIMEVTVSDREKKTAKAQFRIPVTGI